MDQRGNQLREEFSRQFLHGMSDRIQSDFGPKQLERFLNNKFEFFLVAMGKQGLLRLERGKEAGDQDYQTKHNGTATIEIVSPIAPYGVVTLEKLMREKNLHVTRSLTQLARIDFNHRGGRLNTDAIDNSAGVNMSDHEVNLKILLEKMQKLKKITSESKRNHLLEEATDEV